MPADTIHILSRDAYLDTLFDAIEAARARKREQRRREDQALIDAVSAERMARVEHIARALGYGCEDGGRR